MKQTLFLESVSYMTITHDKHTMFQFPQKSYHAEISVYFTEEKTECQRRGVIFHEVT